MTVHCRIMKIDIEKFSADLTCRTSDLVDKNNEWKLPKDTYYDFDSEAADHKQEEDLKRKQQRTSESVLFSLPCDISLPRVLPRANKHNWNKAVPLGSLNTPLCPP